MTETGFLKKLTVKFDGVSYSGWVQPAGIAIDNLKIQNLGLNLAI